MSEENTTNSDDHLAVYKPVWDNWSIVATVIILVIVSVLIGASFGYEEMWYRRLMLAVALSLLSAAFFTPYRVTLQDPQTIRLSFPGYSRHIDLNRYKLIASGGEYAKGSIRIFASGGLFGYPGYWLNKNGKVFTSFLTNYKHNVRFLSDGKKTIALNAPIDWFPEDKGHRVS